MDRTLHLSDLYLAGPPKRGVWLVGHQFGPVVFAIGCDLAEAIDEYDERDRARHVDPSDPDLADYPGDTLAERIEAAMADGDIRVNDGGTMVWVDPYEWIRQFRTVREAGLYFRGVTS